MPFARRKSKEPLTETELFDYAVKSLGARMQSIRDLRRKMKERAEPGEDGEAAMDRILARLVDMRYLSDERYAADFTRLRQENRSLGRRRVQQDLQQKGIAGDLIATTLDAAYEDVDEYALLRQHMERKRIKPPTDEKSTARVLRRLMAAGFSPKTVFTVLRQMKAGDAALDRAEAESADE